VNLRECFEKGLLVRGRASRETVESTIRLARHSLERAKGNFGMRYFDVALTLAYQSMLHSARALLFKDGIKERSHVCVVVYLKEKYGDDPRLSRYINLLDSYRVSRHEIVYRGGYVSEEEGSAAIEDAESFLNAVEELLSQQR
jgi:uncharacterized protein (UPF0332 family)